MRLDLATRTLFAEFQEGVFARTALEREFWTLSVYVRKKVKGLTYWYIQQGNAQKYFGPSNTKNDEVVESHRTERNEKKALLRQLLGKEARQAAMLRRGGLPGIDRRVANVTACLSDRGLIDGRGTLIGTLAFIAYAGILGEIFEKASTRTEDIDIVSESGIDVTVSAPIDIPQMLKETGLHFRAVPALDHGYPSSSFVSSEGVRIDLLVPLRGRPRGVVSVRGIKGAGAVQLPFLDYLVEDPIRTVLIGPAGGVPIQVPHPARFAVHKMITAIRRPVTESAKRQKDLLQSTQLIAALADDEPHELRAAWKDAAGRGKKWSKLLAEAGGLLPELATKVIERIIR
ncbi:MAG: GSU2403 family nucleotidyltransferase fold protein [bacterium]